MILRLILGELVFVFLLVLFLLFALTSFLEGEKRAFKRSLAFFFAVAACQGTVFILPAPLKHWIFLGVLFAGAACLLTFFLSSRPKQTIRITGRQDKYDERDVIFARFDLDRRDPNFFSLYSRRPHFKKIDEEIRKLPDILSPAQIRKNPAHFTLASSEFDLLELFLEHVDGQIGPLLAQGDPSENSKKIKGIISYLGADLCGICELDQAYVYSHVGRGPEPYGQKIVQNHKYAVVFAVQMDWHMISAAPSSPVIIETGKKYVEAARISILAARFVRRMGYTARAHIAGSNYQAVLPPLGWKAGLGEVGRIGILITRQFGPRVRLGLITTDLPLEVDRQQIQGIDDFCSKCKKCSQNCPSKAIPQGDKAEENGVEKWTLNRERCYRYWRNVGTDCAVCVFVCPYSKPASPFHNAVRMAAARSKAAQTLFIWGDDFFYGREPRRKFFPF